MTKRQVILWGHFLLAKAESSPLGRDITAKDKEASKMIDSKVAKADVKPNCEQANCSLMIINFLINCTLLNGTHFLLLVLSISSMELEKN